MNTSVHTIVQALLSARRIVVFTGAGMSADSGIATFRNKSGSHWAKFNPQDLASPDGWRTNRTRVWAWYEARRANVLAAQPNAGHRTIAQLEPVLNQRLGNAVQVSVVTQNVDNLHERAGSADVIHLHGSLFSPRCAICHRPGQFSSTPPNLDATQVEPPICLHCGGYIRPGVVWFGEVMPEAEFELAQKLVDRCDAMLVVGTSGVVYPAAGLPIHAFQQGKFVAEINPTPSEISTYAHVQLSETAAQGLPKLLEFLKT